LKALAHFISYIFHPLFFNFYICCLAIFIHPSLHGRIEGMYLIQIFLLLLISLIVIPILCIYTFKRSGYITSWQIPDKKQRTLPFAFIAILMGITAFNLWESPSFLFVAKLVLCAGLALLINTLLLFYTKPSAHIMAIVGGAAAFFKEGLTWHNNQMILVAAILFFIAGITASARLLLNAHTFSEILFGALIGIFVILPII